MKKSKYENSFSVFGLVFVTLVLLFWPGLAETGGEIFVRNYISAFDAPETRESANILSSGIKAYISEGKWNLEFASGKTAFWDFSTDEEGLKIISTQKYWPLPSQNENRCPDGSPVQFFEFFKQADTTCSNAGEKTQGIIMGPQKLSSGQSKQAENSGSLLFKKEGGQCCQKKEVTITTDTTHHNCIRIRTEKADLDLQNALTLKVRDDITGSDRTYYFDDQKGLVGFHSGNPDQGNFITNWGGDQVSPSSQCLNIGGGGSNPRSRPGEVDIWEYLAATGDQHDNVMENGEHFYSRMIGGGILKMCKNEDCSNWQLFKTDGNTVYHMEDTSWATGYGQNVVCQNGHQAFMRIYNGSGIICEDGNLRGAASPQNKWGGAWAPKKMEAGDNLRQTHSIVGFDEQGYSTPGGSAACCYTDYSGTPRNSGDLVHNLILRYYGCLVLPNGTVANEAIILTTGDPGGYGENWYLDDNQGWIGFDMGTSETGNYATNLTDESGQVADTSKCWDIENAAPTSSSISLFGSSYSEAHGRREPDPSHFYVQVAGNEDIISQARKATREIPGLRPLLAGVPAPGWMPEEFEGPLPDYDTVQGAAKAASQRTGVRASLILAMLAHESGYDRFAGDSTYGEALCSSNICTPTSCQECPKCDTCRQNPEQYGFGNPYCPYETTNYCRAFDRIWEEDLSVAGGAHETYGKLEVPLSAPGLYCGGEECINNCGGAMGAAQAMPPTWENLKSDVKRLTGSGPVSPWKQTHAFVFAGVHLGERYAITPECKNSGGARTGKCFGEVCSVASYWGGYTDFAKQIVSTANGIAEDEDIGEPPCSGWGQDPVAGAWQTPIREQDTVRISCDAGCHGYKAWDFSAPTETEIRAAAAGTLTYAGCAGNGYGCYVTMSHVHTDDQGNTQNYETVYGHMGHPYSSRCLNSDCTSGYQAGQDCLDADGMISQQRIGETIGAGETIGKVNLTGCTTGPHLHFEVKKNGVRLDPAEIYGNPNQY